MIRNRTILGALCFFILYIAVINRTGNLFKLSVANDNRRDPVYTNTAYAKGKTLGLRGKEKLSFLRAISKTTKISIKNNGDMFEVSSILRIRVTQDTKPAYNDTRVRLDEQRLSEQSNETRYFKNNNYFHLTKIQIISTNWRVCVNDSGADLDLLVYVMAVPGDFNYRKSTRKTFANRIIFLNMNIVFVLGKSQSTVINRAIAKESHIYGDIVQGDFVDSYSNLTFKSLMTWRWIKHNCRKAKYFMKLDSDVFMNTRKVLEHIINKKLFNPSDLSISGNIWRGHKPNRHKKNKWYISTKDFPENVYPAFAQGFFYILSNQLPPLLYKLSFITKDFWLVNNFQILFLLIL
jgi:hypothetical protein